MSERVQEGESQSQNGLRNRPPLRWNLARYGSGVISLAAFTWTLYALFIQHQPRHALAVTVVSGVAATVFVPIHR